MFSTTISKDAEFSGSRVSIWRQNALAAVISLVILGASGCAVSPNGDGRADARTPEGRKALVASRVNARWDALIKGDLAAAYALLSPASRATLTQQQFEAKTRRDGFRAAKIDTIDCDPAACTVRLLITYDHPMMKGVTTPLQESWVFENGQAWYVYRG
jgi:hypothetical protein